MSVYISICVYRYLSVLVYLCIVVIICIYVYKYLSVSVFVCISFYIHAYVYYLLVFDICVRVKVCRHRYLCLHKGLSATMGTCIYDRNDAIKIMVFLRLVELIWYLFFILNVNRILRIIARICV